MTTRHEFLQQLHELLKPKIYLEIGVQHGWSLQLSKAELSIGVDPNPLITAEALQRELTNEVFIANQTSDDFFETYIQPDAGFGPIDFAFIDGMHLAEFAWRDFQNVAKYCHSGSVVVFDDVLPTTQEMAAREQCPGDWTGDVWKIIKSLISMYPQLVVQLVDTAPTGTMVVTGFAEPITPWGAEIVALRGGEVPAYILDRRHAWSAPAVIRNLQDRGFGA